MTTKKDEGPIRLVSKWWILPGQEPTVLPALQALAETVQAKEMGTLMYLVHVPRPNDTTLQSQPPSSPTEVLFFEMYANLDAFTTHVTGSYFTDFVKQYGACFVQHRVLDATSPLFTCEFLDLSAGFIRGLS